MPDDISLDDLLDLQSQPKPLATIEAIPGDADRVLVTPYHLSVGLRRASALTLRRDLLASITPTGMQYPSGDKSVLIVEVVFSEPLLHDMFQQLSRSRTESGLEFSQNPWLPVPVSDEVGGDLSSHFWRRFFATTPTVQAPQVSGVRRYPSYSGPFQTVQVTIAPFHSSTLAFVHSVAGGVWNLHNVSSMPIAISAVSGTGYVLRSETIYPGTRFEGQWNGPQGTDRIVAEIVRDLPGYPTSDIWGASVEHDVALPL